MSFLALIIFIIALGLVLFLAHKLPLHATIKTILDWVVIGGIILIILKALGVFELLSGVTL